MKSLLTNQTTPCSNGWTYGNEFDSTILTEVQVQRNFPVKKILVFCYKWRPQFFSNDVFLDFYDVVQQIFVDYIHEDMVTQ